MTEQEIKEIWYRQLAWDYSCNIEEIQNRQAVLTGKAYHPERRIFRGDDCFLKLLLVNGKLVVSSEDAGFLEENRTYFEKASAAWFLEPDNLRILEEKLQKRGHTITDYHHFYLPDSRMTRMAKESAKENLHWYEQEEIERFRGDSRFPEALSFIKESPDVLAVTWEEDGEILGMAGASADCDKMWQIGINVLPRGKHRGLGTLLVTHLKEEILRRGKVPFYGTAQSHIQSQRVAVRSGFMPAWAELYTKAVSDE